MEQPQAFTCPYCGRMGYTEMSLQEHVAAEHTETSTEVVGGDFHTHTHAHIHEVKGGDGSQPASERCIPVAVAASVDNPDCKCWKVAVQLYL